MTQKKKHKNKIKQAPDEFRGLYWSFNLPNGKVAFGMSIPCKGNGTSLGLTDGTVNGGISQAGGSGQQGLWISRGFYGVDVGSYTGTTEGLLQNVSLGVTKDPTKSGVVADLSDGQIVVIKY